RAPVRRRLALELEPADRVAVRDELLLVEREVVEVLPPGGLLLAAVVLEQMPEEPPRVALRGAVEATRDELRPLLAALPDRLGLPAAVRRTPPRELRRPLLEQPPMQLVQGEATLRVVGLDLVEEFLLARVEPLLERDGRSPAAAHVG